MPWRTKSYSVVSCPTDHFTSGEMITPADLALYMLEEMIPIGMVVKWDRSEYVVVTDGQGLKLCNVVGLKDSHDVEVMGLWRFGTYAPRILEFIIPVLQEGHTLGDVCERFDIAYTSLRYHLKQLEHRGYITHKMYHWDTVYITESGERYLDDYNRLREVESS